MLRENKYCRNFVSMWIIYWLARSWIEHIPTCARRAIPRLARWVRRDLLVNWEARYRDVLSRPSYSPENTMFQVRIISLARTPARKLATVHSLKQQGISHSVYDAIDGLDDLNRSEVLRYAGTRKQQRMGLVMSTETMQDLEYRDIERAGDKSPRGSETGFVHERLRFGCYMSHVNIWLSIVLDDIPLMVILEDDVVVQNGFLSTFQRTLSQLPDNWGILYLGGCFRKLGKKLSERLYLSRGGLCTHGYVISKLGARALLNGPALRSNDPVDHMMDRAVLSGALLAFHFEPPIIEVTSRRSTLAYGHV